MKCAITASLFVASLLASGFAGAAVITPSNDTYVKIDNSGPYGGDDVILVKKSSGGNGGTVRKGLISFTVPYADMATAASLSLSVSSFDDVNGATSASFHVWGISDQDSTCNADFSEATAKYNKFPEINNSGVGVDQSSNCVVDLGTFTVNATDLNQSITFQSAALTSFVASTSGVVTLLLTRMTDSGSLNTGFASKENTHLPPPALTVTVTPITLSGQHYNTSSQRSDTFCYSTAQATSDSIYLVSSPLADVIWDQYGNLIVRNSADDWRIAARWGLASTVPLTGASAATLCLTPDGNLKIHDGAGMLAMKTTLTTSSSTTLSVDQCTLSLTGDGQVKWQQVPTFCNKPRSLDRGCWNAPTTTQRIAWNDSDGVEVDWTPDGNLVYKNWNGIQWSTGVTGGHQLCVQDDDNVVIYAANGNALWASHTTAADTNYWWPSGIIGVDRCGISISDAFDDEAFRAGTSQCDATVINHGFYWGTGWCRNTGAAGKVMGNENASVYWTSDGRLQLLDRNGNVAWQTNAAGTGGMLCQDSNVITVHDKNDHDVWHSSAGTLSDVFTLAGCTVALAAVPDPRCVGDDPAVAVPAGCSTNPTTVDVHWSASVPGCMASVSGGGFSFTKDMSFGDSTVGAEMWFLAAATNASSINSLRIAVGTGHVGSKLAAALPTTTVPSNYVELLGAAGVSATLFGSSATIFDVNGYVERLNGAQTNAELIAMGTTYLNGPFSAGVDKSVDFEFFSAEQEFELAGFIPVICTESVTGEVGVSASVVAGGSITGTITPYAQLTVEGSAGVGVKGASAGVEGSLTLINLSIPVSEGLNFGDGFLLPNSYTSSAQFQISTLDGTIDLYAELGALKASTTIASWDGFSTTVQLYSQSGNL